MLHKREYFENLENNPRDPSHWHALFLDKSIPFSPDAKAAFLYDSSRKTKQFLYPFVAGVSPGWELCCCRSSKQYYRMRSTHRRMLHRSLYAGMKYFITAGSQLPYPSPFCAGVGSAAVYKR